MISSFQSKLQSTTAEQKGKLDKLLAQQSSLTALAFADPRLFSKDRDAFKTSLQTSISDDQKQLFLTSIYLNYKSITKHTSSDTYFNTIDNIQSINYHHKLLIRLQQMGFQISNLEIVAETRAKFLDKLIHTQDVNKRSAPSGDDLIPPNTQKKVKQDDIYCSDCAAMPSTTKGSIKLRALCPACQTLVANNYKYIKSWLAASVWYNTLTHDKLTSMSSFKKMYSHGVSVKKTIVNNTHGVDEQHQSLQFNQNGPYGKINKALNNLYKSLGANKNLFSIRMFFQCFFSCQFKTWAQTKKDFSKNPTVSLTLFGDKSNIQTKVQLLSRQTFDKDWASMSKFQICWANGRWQWPSSIQGSKMTPARHEKVAGLLQPISVPEMKTKQITTPINQAIQGDDDAGW